MYFASLLALASGLGAAGDCPTFSVDISTQATFESCASPLGVCTEGVLSTQPGAVVGKTRYLAMSAASAAGMPGVVPETILSYAGVLTITTAWGQLVLHDVGTLDFVAARYAELASIVSGTGYFAGATGTFTIAGPVFGGGLGFGGTIEGSLCLRPEAAGLPAKLFKDDD
jgi:hypothetical protein